MNDINYTDFNSDEYLRLNEDLSYLNINRYFEEFKSGRNFHEILSHYINHGIKENRIYKIDIPEDFCLDTYRENNPDIMNQTDNWLKWHFMIHGKKENRIYKKK